MQGAMDGGAICAMPAKSALPPSLVVVYRKEPWKAVRICPRMGGQVFAPRQQLLRCPNKLHPCNDAKSALPPSLVVVYRKEPWRRCDFYLQDEPGNDAAAFTH